MGNLQRSEELSTCPSARALSDQSGLVTSSSVSERGLARPRSPARRDMAALLALRENTTGATVSCHGACHIYRAVPTRACVSGRTSHVTVVIPCPRSARRRYAAKAAASKSRTASAAAPDLEMRFAYLTS